MLRLPFLFLIVWSELIFNLRVSKSSSNTMTEKSRLANGTNWLAEWRRRRSLVWEDPSLLDWHFQVNHDHIMNQLLYEFITRWINHIVIMNWSHHESITWLVVGNYRYANKHRYRLKWNRNFGSFGIGQIKSFNSIEQIMM